MRISRRASRQPQRRRPAEVAWPAFKIGQIRDTRGDYFRHLIAYEPLQRCDVLVLGEDCAKSFAPAPRQGHDEHGDLQRAADFRSPGDAIWGLRAKGAAAHGGLANGPRMKPPVALRPLHAMGSATPEIMGGKAHSAASGRTSRSLLQPRSVAADFGICAIDSAASTAATRPRLQQIRDIEPEQGEDRVTHGASFPLTLGL